MFIFFLIVYWSIFGYLPGCLLSVLVLWILKKKAISMPHFSRWEWSVPFVAMSVSLCFLVFEWGYYRNSLSNISEGLLGGWCWSLFFGLRIGLPWRQARFMPIGAAILTLFFVILIGLFMPCLPE